MGLERVAPASRPPNPLVIRTLWRMMVTQLVTPAADRPFPQARGLGHRLQPAVPQFEGFAGRPAAPSSLIEIRLKAGELSSEDFDNASVYHVINVVQIDEIGQLFIYDDIRRNEACASAPRRVEARWSGGVWGLRGSGSAVGVAGASTGHLGRLRCTIMKSQMSANRTS